MNKLICAVTVTNRTILSLAITVVGAVASADAGLIPDRVTLDAILGGNAVNEDFESYVVTPGDSVILETRFLDSTIRPT